MTKFAKLVAGFLLALVTNASSAVVRPYPPEQWIADNLGWPAAITHRSDFQPQGEFAFMDSSAGDTCEPSYPFDPRIAAEGVTDCYDLAIPNWQNVTCTGSSAPHPSLSNVYVMRPSSPNWNAANNSNYRWVVVCPGSYTGLSAITVSASGVGFGPGQMRIYGCLESDGSWDPMKYAVHKVGTADECHLESVALASARYTWFTGFYFEGTSKEWTREAFKITGSGSTKMFSGLNNFVVYGGGQTRLGTGYASTFTTSIDAGQFMFIQNGLVEDCTARNRADDKAYAARGGQTSFSYFSNLEQVNCSYFLGGQDFDTASWGAQGNRYENVWFEHTYARMMDQMDPRYWWAAYSSQDKIPYGFVGGGQPPSYVKATAVTSGELNDSFECGPKPSASCPFVCSETIGIQFKKGAMRTNEPHVVRRVFAEGYGISRRDGNNDISNDPGAPNQTHTTCGGSSGTQGHIGRMGGQYNACGIEYDLVVTTAPGYSAHLTVSPGSQNNYCTGIKVTNSLVHTYYDPDIMNNQYVDDWHSRMVNLDQGTNIPGEANEYRIWGSTHVMTNFDQAPAGVYEQKRWMGNRSGVDVSLDCSVVVGYENDQPDGNMTARYIGRYGNAGTLNSIQNAYPSGSLSNTYDENDLQPFVRIVGPWTTIRTGVITTREIPYVIPQEGSPVAGQCQIAKP